MTYSLPFKLLEYVVKLVIIVRKSSIEKEKILFHVELLLKLTSLSLSVSLSFSYRKVSLSGICARNGIHSAVQAISNPILLKKVSF